MNQYTKEIEELKKQQAEKVDLVMDDPLDKLIYPVDKADIENALVKGIGNALRCTWISGYNKGLEKGGVQRKDFEDMKIKMKSMEDAFKSSGWNLEALELFNMMSPNERAKIRFAYKIRSEMVSEGVQK